MSYRTTVRFKIHFRPLPGQRIIVVGANAPLGAWKPEQGVQLKYKQQDGFWEGEARFSNARGTYETLIYKYVLFIEETKEFSWEWGQNRVINLQDKLPQKVSSLEMITLVDYWREPREKEKLVTRFLKVDKIMLTALPEHSANNLLLALSFSKQVNLIPVKELTIHGDFYYLISQSQIEANKESWKVDLFTQDLHGHKEKIGESNIIPLNTVMDHLFTRLSYNSQSGGAKINVRGVITLSNNKGSVNFDLEVVLMTQDQIHEDIQKYYKLMQDILVKESQILMKRANTEKKKPVEEVLQRRKEKYVWANEPLLPPHPIANLSKEKDQLVFRKAELTLQLLKLIAAESVKTLPEKDINNVKAYSTIFARFHDHDTFKSLFNHPVPTSVIDDAWDRDIEFGREQVIGLNPATLLLVPSVVIRKVFAQLDETKISLAKTLDVEADKENRFFLVDYRETFREIEPSNSPRLQHMIRPTCLFRMNEKNELLPVAIQLHWRDDHTSDQNPIFYAEDQSKNPKLWFLVKLWYRMAEANHHQYVSHLALNYIVADVIATCLNRHLPSSHPIYKLLKPHFHGTNATQEFVRSSLLPSLYSTATVLSASENGGLKLINRAFNDHKFTSGYFLNELTIRAVDDVKKFPYYPYRDFGKRLHGLIKDMVANIFDVLYNDNKEVEHDAVLQSFFQSLSSEGKLRGVPEKIKSIKELTEICTNIIWITTVQHSAVNFTRYEHLSLISNLPLTLQGIPPTSNTQYVTDDDIAKTLPDLETTYLQLLLANIYSAPVSGNGQLKNFINTQFTDSKILDSFSTLRDKLKIVTAEFNQKNLYNPNYAYYSMMPDNISTSNSI
eukprot:TRINITY_DN1970_c0_g1_i1.p1 TRINITY_DN1970_c0_g1~~TRINITY_DN1970_c0_g1_i1.p1  ORF type:complete len:842 (+),score=205.85 TRINITY_DN1970_c0_g1_i1:66-2591(+)